MEAINSCSKLKFSQVVLWRRPLSYRNQSMDWFLYDRDPRHERTEVFLDILSTEKSVNEDIVRGKQLK